MIFSLIIGLIFHVFVILQIFFEGWFESRNTGKMWILDKEERLKFHTKIDSKFESVNLKHSIG